MRLLRFAASVALAASLITAVAEQSSAAIQLRLRAGHAVHRVKPLAPLTLGFSNGADVALASGNSAIQAKWVPRAKSERAQLVKLGVSWAGVAPRAKPAKFNASSPSDPSYNWTAVDQQVRELAAGHFTIMIVVGGAPAWAEGPNMPRTATPGTWEPNARDFSQFARALAKRYDGSYPDPLHRGRFLPRIRIWQAWDEPNLPIELSPQWRRSGSRGYTPVSPGLYRNLENAFYKAVKGVSRSNYVVLAGLAPYGDAPSTNPLARMQPVAFERSLLCVTQRFTRQPGCSGPTSFDAIDSHPYGVGGPNWHALNADDVSVPDIYKLARVLHAAERLGTAQPRGRKGDWVTETSWDTNPPDPHGIPIQKQARWLEQALYNLWKQGVSTVLWWQIQDSPPIPNYAASYQAGTYYLNGRPKPSATSFRFPFITWRTNYKTVMVWARAPATGVLSVQARTSGRWQTLARVSVTANEVFELPVQLLFRRELRATVGGYSSLPWTQAG